MPLRKIIKYLIVSGLFVISVGLPAQANEGNRNFESGVISHEEKVCPAAGCRVVCISYQTGQSVLDKQFRHITVTRFTNSDIRIKGKSGIGETDIFMNSRRAICHISS